MTWEERCAENRRLIQSMFDGKPPYAIAELDGTYEVFLSKVGMIRNDALREASLELTASGVHDFWSWPASLSFHHAYEGGLVRHTLEVVDLALHMAEKFPKVNRDVLIAACLWHDLMKIREYKVVEELEEGQRNLVFTHCDAYTQYWVKDPKCRSAHDHIITSAQEFVVAARAAGVDPVTEELVSHCILAHHGPVRDWGSPVAPQTLEAWLLHQADMLSAKFGATK